MLKMKTILTALLMLVSIAVLSEKANAVSTTIVISQVNGGGGGSTGTYLFDYVELKNISSSPQSLNGLSLYYGSAVGQFASTAGNAFVLPNVTLNPGQYYFVQTGPTGSAGAAFPVTPDVVTGNLTMSGTSGKVALATSGLPINTCGATATPCSAAQLGALVDWVAYGAAGNGTAGMGEGGTSVNNGTAITSSQGAVRKTAGCTETDNNNNDFDLVTAPVPRNMATAAAPCTAAAPSDAPVDFNGDGRTDYVVVRSVGGTLNWYWNLNGTSTTVSNYVWGLSTDVIVPADFDGDGRDDVAIWRPGANAFFYIIQSQTDTFRIEQFGTTGDNPTVVADYNGDGRDDIAVYRPGTQSFWYYRTVSNGQITFVPWGTTGDNAAPGDYDGNGSADFSVTRNEGGSLRHYQLMSTGAINMSNVFGLSTDTVITGDFDADGRTDLATVRSAGGVLTWYWRRSTDGGFVQAIFGLPGDTLAPGDYDGDGRMDLAVFRNGVFYSLNSVNFGVSYFTFGLGTDRIPAAYNAH